MPFHILSHSQKVTNTLKPLHFPTQPHQPTQLVPSCNSSITYNVYKSNQTRDKQTIPLQDPTEN